MPDTRPKLLIVEDDAGLQRQLRWSYDAYRLFVAGNRHEAVEIMRAEAPPVVTLDLGLPPDPDGVTEGFATLAELLRIAPETKVIIASGHGELESARRSIALGAWDFYQKPIDIDALRHIVARAFHVHGLERANLRDAGHVPSDHLLLGRLVSAAPEMAAVAHMAERAAESDVPLLVLGAPGSGRATLARAVHDRSGYRNGPFAVGGCAVTDATEIAEAVARAQGGTLYLDGVEELAAPAQATLHALLRDGGNTRLIASATPRLAERRAAGLFRDDLYHRIAGLVVALPRLCERAGDPVLLARHFLRLHGAALHPQLTDFAADALAALEAWQWPGEVRELENRVKRAILLAQGRTVAASDLDLPVPGAEAVEECLTLKAARERADRHAIRAALSRTDGNISTAARLLGVSRPTLYDLIRNYDIAV